MKFKCGAALKRKIQADLPHKYRLLMFLKHIPNVPKYI